MDEWKHIVVVLSFQYSNPKITRFLTKAVHFFIEYFCC